MSQRELSILVAGATGYVGGRLVPRLVERGHRVRCLARDPGRVSCRGWDAVDVAVGDLLDGDSLAPLLDGIDVCYYLVHSMAAGEEFARRDRKAALNFARAARAAGVRRIIYLGGLGNEDEALSLHLKSRQETGRCLRSSGIPVTEFRAGVIVGSGSLSFELIRYLTERIPLLVAPPGIRTRAQPIGIRDLLRYLVDCLEVPGSAGKVIEIGGPEVLSYEDMILTYARLRGLKRRVLVLPFATPRALSWWASLITPMPAAIVRPVFDSIDNEVVCRGDLAERLFGFRPLSYEENIKLALMRIETGTVESVWSDAFSSTCRDTHVPVELADRQGMIIEKRQRLAQASAESAFWVISRIGGSNGWPYANALWRLRGFFDRMLGGVGLREPRRHPEELRVGDALDFWRVEALQPGRLLRLRSEMRLPGLAWLQFEVEPKDVGVLLTQTAFYEPRGLWGHLYWIVLYPVHREIFSGIIRSLAREAEQVEQGGLGGRRCWSG